MGPAGFRPAGGYFGPVESTPAYTVYTQYATVEEGVTVFSSSPSTPNRTDNSAHSTSDTQTRLMFSPIDAKLDINGFDHELCKELEWLITINCVDLRWVTIGLLDFRYLDNLLLPITRNDSEKEFNQIID